MENVESVGQRRAAAVAGSFYPGAKEELREEMRRCLVSTTADSAPLACPRALIVPHAGTIYSGTTAGKAYARVRSGAGTIRRVVVIAPSHRVAFHGVSVGDFTEFATPLGLLPVDRAACARLVQASPLVSTRDDAQLKEHAVEVQLPFIQTVLPGVSLVPMVCGELTPRDIVDLGKVLHDELWRADTLWVISSDFTHFGSTFGYVPFTRDVPKRLKELDAGAIQLIEKRDLDGFLAYVERTGATICGATPIALLLAATTAEPVQVNPLAYSHSAALTQDWEQVVDYAALELVDSAAAPTATTPTETLNAEERRQLLELARQTIDNRLQHRPPFRLGAGEITPMLKAPLACFVTLKERDTGLLRGCIGHLTASEPLWQNVARNAANAAFHDPRFNPVTAAELPGLEIEISVLTSPRPATSLAEFVLGKHGIILTKGGASAVFLPQVAPEQGWDKETTLRHLSLKAGLPADAWRRGASFELFEAIVFGE